MQDRTMEPDVPPDATPSALFIRTMTTSGDELDAYARLVCPGMSPDDVHKPAEFAGMLATGELVAWYAREGVDVVGWAALAPAHGKYLPGAWHLYGCWVRPDRRGRGIARRLWEHRLSTIPSGTVVTTSIQPGKADSEALARSFGFVEIGTASPWTNYATTLP